MAPKNDSGGIQKELAALVQTLQESGRQANEERRSLAAKVDRIPELFAEQRRELERVFVPISRYDPERAAMLARMDEYDRIIRAAAPQQAEYEQLKATVRQQGEILKDQDDTIESMKQRAQGQAARALPFIGIAISIITVLITILGHVHIN